MKFIKSVIWNSNEKRIRAFFRILSLIFLAGIFAAMISWISNDFNELLEKSIMNFLIMLAILLSIYLVGKYIDRRNWADFGISVIPLKQFIYGSLFGSFLEVTIFLIQYFLGWLTIDEIKFNKFSSFPFLVVLMGQVFRYLCGSVFEEAFSRGYLLLNIAEGLKGKINNTQAVIIAYILTSSIFGLLHLANENASWLSSLNLILIGFLLGWTVIKTGKLHFAIGLHAFWNIFQNNIFGFANSGKKSIVSIYTFENSGSTLWTGGEFGIEGGLLCTITVLLALILLSYPEIVGNRRLDQKVLK
ncbi:CPBP family intramembrane glutamic endopeptidase [Spongiimicrobium sp. 2-473A-2-J]|uniref:CPBP family intramembrane glutamic endopeptidase n=1 Tax=Eudoraea algarum TaxID=3417568 RepID=UPI003D365BAE